MIFAPFLRKLVLTAHITTSVGWLGSVVAWLVLSIAGLNSPNAQTMRAAYLSMDLTARFVIVPLALLSLITGITQSLGTSWGLVRHYWVVAKLLLTVVATVVLLLKMEQIGSVARMAAQSRFGYGDLRQSRIELVGHAGGGLAVLLVTTILSVFKPWGTTPFGKGKRSEQDQSGIGLSNRSDEDTSHWRRVIAGAVILLISVFIILHLIRGSHGPH